MAFYGAEAVTIDRNARGFEVLDQIEWKSWPGSASQSATLFGAPSKPVFMSNPQTGPHAWSQPYSHAD
jgi:hypothetical protein